MQLEIKRAEVTNLGHTRAFPTCLGNVFIAKAQTVLIENRKAVEELRRYPFLKFKIVLDYSELKKPELIKRAKQLGAKNAFFMKKVDLVKFMEETNGISNR